MNTGKAGAGGVGARPPRAPAVPRSPWCRIRARPAPPRCGR
jgi:hypothetical protein